MALAELKRSVYLGTDTSSTKDLSSSGGINKRGSSLESTAVSSPAKGHQGNDRPEQEGSGSDSEADHIPAEGNNNILRASTDSGGGGSDERQHKSKRKRANRSKHKDKPKVAAK